MIVLSTHGRGIDQKAHSSLADLTDTLMRS